MTVLQLVARERARLSLAIIARGAAGALAVLAVVVALGVVALGDARWITRPAAPLLVWGAALALLVAALWWTGRAVRRHASAANVAAAIERERALRSGALRGALEVAGTGALGRRAAESLAGTLRAGGALAPATQSRAWHRGLVAGGVAALALVALGAARDAAPDGWRAVRHPVRAWTGSLLGPLVIVDPPRAVLRGERLKLLILAPERRQVTLSTRTTGAPWRTQLLPVTGGSAEVTLGPLDADLVLVAADGRTSTDSVLVRVTDRPFVGDVAIRAQYPAYLARPAEVIPVGEPARLPRGTVLTIRGRASTTLTAVGLMRSADTLRLTTDGHSFSGRLSALESGRWTWVAVGTQGPIADVPPALEIEVVPDSAPQVEILAPAGDSLVLTGDRLTLRAAATDDHGVADVLLRSWRRPAGGQPQPEVAQPLAAPNAPQWSGEAMLDLATRMLVPGDELHVVVAATDASPWRQTGVSRELVLRIPSLEERREMARALGDSAAAHASAAAKAQRQLEQRTGEAARSRGQRAQANAADQESRRAERAGDRSSQAMSFEAAERSRALAEEQQQLQEQVRALQRDAQALEEQLKAAGALDTALARQLRDAQQLLGEALTPELQAQLQKPQEATQRLSADDVRRSLAELQEQQQRLREQLERTAEMLKRAALEGSMQTLRDDAQELAAKERAVADSLARGDSAAAQRSRALSERSRDLSEQIAQVAKRLEQEKAEAGPEKLQDAAKSAERSADAMRRAGTADRDAKRAPQRGQQRQGESRQQTGADSAGQREQQAGGENQEQGEGQQSRADAARDGARQMEAAAQQLSDARQSQISEWKQELTGELDRSIQEALQLARQQSALAERAKAGEQADQMRGDQAAVQQGTQKVSERLQRAAGKSAHVSPQSQSAVGDARRKVEEATEQVGESRRGGAEAGSAMEEAAQALNRAAAALVRDRERAGSAQSASGFAEMLQQMQEMAKQQGQINAQSAGLMPTPGQQPGAQALQRARSLGQQQRSLASRLDDAAGGGAAARAEQMAKEMRDIADALEQGRLDQAMLDRQQRLFRRLLDAGLSLEKEEREDRGERESRAATGAEVLTPGGTGQGRSAVRFREPTWSELRGLSAEERRAVLEYFKRINAERP